MMSKSELTDAEKAEFEAAGDRVKGAFLPENALRMEKLIYLAKKADFTSLNHEMIHEKMKALGEDERREWADAVGLADNSAEGWNAMTFDGRDGGKISAHEYIAEKWEDYLASPDNPAIPAKLKPLFDRIAAAMRRVYEALGRTVREVEPELKAMFDRLIEDGAANSGKDGGKTALDGKKGVPLGRTVRQNKGGNNVGTSVPDVSGLVNTYADVGNSGVSGESNMGVEKNDTNVDSLKNASKAYENVGNKGTLFSLDGKDGREKFDLRQRAETLLAMNPVEIDGQPLEKDGALSAYKEIGQVKNKYTGQEPAFVTNAFYKIARHKGFDNRIISKLPELFENAVFMYSEPVNTDHKVHTNFTGYSHYVAKTSIGGEPVYVRFTIENLKTKSKKTGRSQFHSVHLSVLKKSVSPRVDSSVISPATWGSNDSTDSKLQNWLNSALDTSLSDNSAEKSTPLFQLIGEKGATALDRANEATERLDGLDAARKMEAAGKNAKTVRLATGWERGADNLWRYEIPDIKIRINPTYEYREVGSYDIGFTNFNRIKLGDMADGGGLFEAYPGLRDITVTVTPDMDSDGTYFHATKEIYIRSGVEPDTEELADIFMRKGWGSTREEAKRLIAERTQHKDNVLMRSPLIHEIQHAIQNIEGFAPGGDEKLGAKLDYEELRQKAVKFYGGLPDRMKKQISEYYELKDKYLAGAAEYAEVSEARGEIARETGTVDGVTFNDYDTWHNFDEKAAADSLVGYSTYRRIAGEAEARNVQTRMGYTPDERRERLLAETEDVSRGDQIVIRNAVNAVSAGTLPYNENAPLFSLEPESTGETEENTDNKGMKTTDWQGLQDFIGYTMADRNAPYKRLVIGTVSNATQKKLNTDFGFIVKNINIDNSVIIHAMGKPANNLEPDDLLHAVDVINTAEDIALSPEKNQNNRVLVFKKDINGELTILAEVRKKNEYLSVFDAWRKIKARRHPDAVNTPPGTNALNASPHADTPLSDASANLSTPR
jgi:hypothetical protein